MLKVDMILSNSYLPKFHKIHTIREKKVARTHSSETNKSHNFSILICLNFYEIKAAER